MEPGPPGWGLGVELTIPPHKKLPVRKPEIWPRKGLEEVHYGGEGPHWPVVPTKKKKNYYWNLIVLKACSELWSQATRNTANVTTLNYIFIYMELRFSEYISIHDVAKGWSLVHTISSLASRKSSAMSSLSFFLGSNHLQCSKYSLLRRTFSLHEERLTVLAQFPFYESGHLAVMACFQCYCFSSWEVFYLFCILTVSLYIIFRRSFEFYFILWC